jgi:predicted RNA methylase
MPPPSSLALLRTSALILGIVATDLRSAVVVHGVWGTLLRCFGHLGELLTLRASYRRARSLPDAFDVDHGVHTNVAMDLRDLHEVKRRGGEEHEPTPAAKFFEILAGLDVRFEETVFVDFGSGAGRVVLLASEQPFKAVIGVELCPWLHALSRRNVAAYPTSARRCGDIQLVCADATTFTLSPDPAVLYFYNPFRGDVMRRVLRNIERSLEEHPRPVTIVHLWPRRETRRLFEASPFFTLVPSHPDVAVLQSRRSRHFPSSAASGA